MTRRRWALLCAAPPAFYLAASLVLFIGLRAWGGPAFTKQQRIASVISGTPAQSAGLRAGDVLVSIDGQPTDVNHPPRVIVDRAQGRPVRVAIERGTASHEIAVTPRFDDGHWTMGVQLMPVERCERVPLALAASESLRDPARRLVQVARSIKAAFRRADVYGPAGIIGSLSAPPCTRKLQMLTWIEIPLAACSVFALLVLLGFVINSARRSRSSSG